jgi:hypothetical protein
MTFSIEQEVLASLTAMEARDYFKVVKIETKKIESGHGMILTEATLKVQNYQQAHGC